MGRVFVAENMAIGLRVAIKVLKPELLRNPVFQTRFQREAEAIAAIQHPNVVRFLDLVLGDPTFLVMEFVRGPTLSQVLQRESRIDALRAVSIAARLAWALHAVHSAGVVHRDLKPGNILLTKDPELGESPKLIDFGVVRFAAITEGQQVTRAGQIVGTLHYMAPEQIDSGNVDWRADCYSLGCVLYQMLTGAPPFVDSDDEGQLLYRIVHQAAPPLADAAPGLPPKLLALVDRLLSKDPSARAPSMPNIARELTAIGSEIVAPPQSVPKPRPPRRGLVLAAAFGALLGAAPTWRFGRLSQPRPQASVAGNPNTLLSISSRPRAAIVELDGRPLDERTPTSVRGLALGVHRLRLSLSGHQAVEQALELGPEGREAVDIALPPASRSVEVRTVPPGAVVYLDGNLALHRTPLTLEVTEDDFHSIRIEQLGYQTRMERITPDSREPTLTFTLESEREPRGAILVDSNSAARVFIDGADSGFNAPTTALPLSAGPHSVQLRDSLGGSSSLKRIQLHAGETLHLPLDLNSGRRRP